MAQRRPNSNNRIHSSESRKDISGGTTAPPARSHAPVPYCSARQGIVPPPASGIQKSMVDTAAQVARIISTHLGIAQAVVVPGASLVDDLGADSLDTVELVIAFETAFDIVVPEADVEHIRTVQDAIDYVEARQQPS
jgi:acyl carrier protein